jgi:hypothetical protein
MNEARFQFISMKRPNSARRSVQGKLFGVQQKQHAKVTCCDNAVISSALEQILAILNESRR